jgi:hypothetical protein
LDGRSHLCLGDRRQCSSTFAAPKAVPVFSDPAIPDAAQAHRAYGPQQTPNAELRRQ